MGPPIPFREFDLPRFPTHALPGWLEEFVVAIGGETQTPTDLAGVLVLATCATALARKVRVVVRDGWEEPVNLFAVVALPSASRKSPVFRAASVPIVAYERWRISEERPEVAAAKQKHSTLNGRRKRAETMAQKEDHDGPGSHAAEAERLARELSMMKVPEEPKFVCADVTSEKLANLLYEQGGRMALLSAEGGIFGIISGRYSDGNTNFEVFLQGHAGDELRVDRLSRQAEYVDRPALTLGICIQPSMLRRLPPEFRDRGLMGRFLYAIPESGLGRRKPNAPTAPKAIKEEYYRNLTALLELPFDPDSDPEPLRPTPEALEVLLKFVSDLEPRLEESSGDLGHMNDWGGKLAGAVVRIAGLLHCAINWQSLVPWEMPIEWETMERATTLGEYLIPHAKAAYGEMGADPAIKQAKHMLRWIEKNGLTTFTRRDMYQALKGSYGRVEELEPGLDALVSHGYIRPERAVSPALGAGRPSQIFTFYTYDQNPQNPQKP